MRRLLALVIMAMLAASCGMASNDSYATTVTAAPTVDEPTSSSTTPTPRSVLGGALADTPPASGDPAPPRPASTPTPTAIAPDLAFVDPADVDDVLLPDSALAAPWRSEFRLVLPTPLAFDGTHLNCDEFHLSGPAAGTDSGNALWQHDGGVLFQWVSDAGDPVTAQRYAEEVATLADRCGSVSFTDGGAMSVAQLDLGLDDSPVQISAFEFTDDIMQRWVSVVSYGELTSVLVLMAWPSAVDTQLDLAAFGQLTSATAAAMTGGN